MSDVSTFIDAAISNGQSNASAIRLGLLASLGKCRLLTVVRYTSGPQTLAGNADLVTCDCASGSFTVNFPAAPLDGDTYEFYKETASNTLTIGRNGKTIDFAAADSTLTSAQGHRMFTWSAAANTWISRA